MKARLARWREIAPQTRHFEFESEEWEAAFVPGQFLSLTAEIAGDSITRAYSIVSPPGGRTFALCANLVSEGHFSPLLFSLKEGDAFPVTLTFARAGTVSTVFQVLPIGSKGPEAGAMGGMNHDAMGGMKMDGGQ